LQLCTAQFRPAGLAIGRSSGNAEGDMTQTSNRLLDEFAKLMTDAAGVAQGLRREVETAIKSQAERFLGEMDVVQREEFEAVREMAVRAREENEALRRRIEELEGRFGAGMDSDEAPAAPIKRGPRKRSGGDGTPGADAPL
jgi:BMFP domain-containing protein YqiC